MSESQLYDFNFFKPKSAYASANAKLISSIVLIWALAVFGFHFLMKAIEQPVPEKQLATFEQVWPNVMDNTASKQQLQKLSGIYLNLMARHIPLRTDENFRLSFTSTVYNFLPDHEKQAFLALTQKDLSERKSMTSNLATSLGLEKDSLLAQVLPYGLVSYSGEPIDDQIQKTIPGTMKKYLTHYRSVLTDTKILGFPFHYFYTAVFLLVLFVMLCLVYCKIFDGVAKKYGMEDEEVAS